MNNLLTYSNGWGHLIMSIATMAAGIFLIVYGQTALGSSLLGIVTAAWFVPGAAKQVAQNVAQEVASTTKGPVGPTGPSAS
jgi:hypothetical protein